MFKREEQKPRRIIEGQWTLPEFEYLQNNIWTFTEKVDGTNIRVLYNHEQNIITFGGKTETAQIPTTLVTKLYEMFPVAKLDEVFDTSVCLYGEGYGPKIQKGGGNYGAEQSFVLFDIKIGDWWLRREDVNGIADKLGIRSVPVIGEGTLHHAIRMVRLGELKSQWGNFEAEGIVARPKVELFTRSGQRIITKIKTRDFK